MPAAEAISTTPASEITQVYGTVKARLTQGSGLTQTATPSPQVTRSPISGTPATPEPSAAPGTAPSTPGPTLVCDRAAAGNPIDLTIPDDTLMQPGQAFTKRWALQNAGSCTWTTGYAVQFLYGEQMGAPDSARLSEYVQPGQRLEVAIDMVAPTAPGTYRGNWKLRNTGDTLFGIGPNGSSPFWVQIIVVQPPTDTPGPATSTPAPTPTITATPAPVASGFITLIPGSRLDLDAARVNPESDADLTFESQPDGTHALVPQGTTRLGLYGPYPPSLSECQASSMDTQPVTVENLGSTYLCYETGQGLPGRALVTNLKIDDFTLSLDLLTWPLP